MKYRVVWRRLLLSQLAGFYVSAREQGLDAAAITRATDEIDQLLSTRPQTRGESRADDERILFVPPLSVSFEVHEEEQLVFVLRVGYRPGAGS